MVFSFKFQNCQSLGVTMQKLPCNVNGVAAGFSGLRPDVPGRVPVLLIRGCFMVIIYNDEFQ